MKTILVGGLLGLLFVGCGGTASSEEVGDTTQDILLDESAKPLPCADPTVFSVKGDESNWVVFCTGMAHVWETSNWTTFTDERKSLQFDFGKMAALSQKVDQWWAPTVMYSTAEKGYVMWVSVIAGHDYPHPTRSLAVFKSKTPLGPWTFEGIPVRATEDEQMNIDPMVVTAKDGDHYAFWKRYGGGLNSRIMGARLTSTFDAIDGDAVELLDAYDSSSWEGNVRENPAVWQDSSTGHWHMLYSGGAWRNGSYATGYAESDCGALCLDEGEGWRIRSSDNRHIAQVVQANGDKDYVFGGPGGAVWGGSHGEWIVYAAAALSASGDHTRYLMKDNVKWENGAPYVDTAGHRPTRN